MISGEKRMEEKYGKVYRDYFSVQTTNWAVSYPDEDIPGILKKPFLRDVSDEYFGRNVAVVRFGGRWPVVLPGGLQ